MRRWLWTFGCDTMFAKKYIIVTADDGDGREILFKIYGRDNMAMPYLLDYEPNKEEKVRKEYGYEKIAEWRITDEKTVVEVCDRQVYLRSTDYENFNEFKHEIWDKMIGGI